MRFSYTLRTLWPLSFQQRVVIIITAVTSSLAVRDDRLYAFDQLLLGHVSMVEPDGHALVDTVGHVGLLVAEHRYADHRHSKVYGLHDAHQPAVRYEHLDVPVTCAETKRVDH